MVVEQGKKEVDKGFLPKIQPLDKSLDDYDTVIIGFPVWWYTFAPAVNTFLKNNDLSNKTVSLFATNGGWVGNTFENFEKECAGANIKKGINIRFDKNILITPEKNIKVWVKEI